tara:strand:+ start:521 stop:679 length:159 start_codon:yes stop_codon:yes gene_type:complete
MDLQLKGRMKMQNSNIEQASWPPPVSTFKLPKHAPNIAGARTIKRNAYTKSI